MLNREDASLDYLNADFPVDVDSLSEAQLRHEIELRRSVHMLRTNAANCLRGLITFEPVEMLLPETIGQYFNDMLHAATTHPQELARQLLLEQSIIAKHLISHLAVEAAQSGSVEVTSAYTASIARLQAELRRNVKALNELPGIKERQAEKAERLTEAQLLAAVGSSTHPITDPEPSEHAKNDLRSEQGSNDRKVATSASENAEPSQDRSGQTQPYSSQGTVGIRPSKAQRGSFTEPAVAQGHRPADAGRKGQGSPERPTRQDNVEAEDPAIALIREAAARRYAEVADQFARSCVVS